MCSPADFMSRVYANFKHRKHEDPGFEMPDLNYERIFDPSEFDMRENVIFLKEEPDNPMLCVGLDEILRAAHYKPRDHGGGRGILRSL